MSYMPERYPTAIINFDAWFNEVRRRIVTAQRNDQIDAAIDLVRPYADARWCRPERLTEAQHLAIKRRREINNYTDRMTGDGEDVA